MLRAFVINGDSMSPILSSGDFVLARTVPWRCLRPGMIAFLEGEPNFVVCKRIVETFDDHQFRLRSDNLECSSFYEGSVQDFKNLLGVMLFRLPRLTLRQLRV